MNTRKRNTCINSNKDIVMKFLGSNPGSHSSGRIQRGTGICKSSIYYILRRMQEAGLIIVIKKKCNAFKYSLSATGHCHIYNNSTAKIKLTMPAKESHIIILAKPFIDSLIDRTIT